MAIKSKQSGLFQDNIRGIVILKHGNNFTIELEYIDGSRDILQEVFNTKEEAERQVKMTLIKINEK